MDEHLLTDEDFRLFRDLIVRTTGTSIPVEKRAMLRARLAKRLRFNDLGSFREYYDFIAHEGRHSPELREMINCLAASRQAGLPDPRYYSELVDEIISEALQSSIGVARPRIRLWVAGCWMGQATYSLAIALSEAMAASKRRWDVKILASDSDLFALARAESGVYECELAESFPYGIQQRYLKRGSGNRVDYVKVDAAVCDLITFRQIDLAETRWPMHQNMRYDAILIPGRMPNNPIAARLHEKLTSSGRLVVNADLCRPEDGIAELAVDLIAA